MESDTLTKYFFIGLLLVLVYFTFLIVKPFATYLIMGVLLTYFTYPVYLHLNTKIKTRGIAAGLMIVIILLVLIIPTILVTKTLVNQATTAVSSLNPEKVEEVSAFLANWGIEGEQVNEIVRDLLRRLSNFIVGSASDLLGSLAEITLGIVVLFFVMYYGFKEGASLYKSIEDHIPLKPKHKEKLISDFHKVSYAVLYGQVMTAIIQGVIGGIGFLIFGLPNPVFWGFIMTILSFLPIVGTPLVFGPAGLIQIANGHYISGIGILIYGGVLVMNIDNVLKPTLISGKAEIHPVVILVGVLGGLTVFGFAGIILGPLVMALLITMLKFYTEEKTFVL